jgi:Tfp pilus assembly protein PilO
MNRMTKQQKERIGMIAFGTVVIIAVLWIFGVMAKQTELERTREKTRMVRKTLKDAEAEMSRGQEIAAKLQMRSDILAKREATLAPDRDAYAWIIQQINPFIQSMAGVNIPTYSQPEVNDLGILPGFPYKWATFHLRGSGYYYEFGRFFADLENTFPYFRVQNLAISANSTPGVDPEKLAYTFDLVVPMTSTDIK